MHVFSWSVQCKMGLPATTTRMDLHLPLSFRSLDPAFFTNVNDTLSSPWAEILSWW